jgi:CheY-like chemotaxis protein
MTTDRIAQLDQTYTTVLVADGDVLVRSAIVAYLRQCGYQVVEAANSDEVLAVLQSVSFDIDIILCDAMIGGSMNGFELARHIRSLPLCPEVVIAGSVNSTAEAAADICEKGPRLSRPYEPKSVVEHIKRMMANRTRLTAAEVVANRPQPEDKKP